MTTLNRNELREELKAYREMGYTLQIKLTASTEAMREEYNRIHALDNAPIAEGFDYGDMTLEEIEEYGVTITEADTGKYINQKVKPSYIDETYKANGTLSTFHLDYCLPNDATEQPYTFTANAYGIKQARAAIRKERPGLMYLGCKRVEPIETGRVLDIGAVDENDVLTKFRVGDTEFVVNCGNVSTEDAIDFVNRRYSGCTILFVDGKEVNQATDRVVGTPSNIITVPNGEKFTVDSVIQTLQQEGYSAWRDTLQPDQIMIDTLPGFIVVHDTYLIFSSEALVNSGIGKMLQVAGYDLSEKPWNRDDDEPIELEDDEYIGKETLEDLLEADQTNQFEAENELKKPFSYTVGLIPEH